MPIGEFGGAAAAGGARGPTYGPMYAAPAYWLYELSHAALNPARAFADAGRLFFKNPANPLAHTPFGKATSAAFELFERSTRRYGQPTWNIASTHLPTTPSVSFSLRRLWFAKIRLYARIV